MNVCCFTFNHELNSNYILTFMHYSSHFSPPDLSFWIIFSCSLGFLIRFILSSVWNTYFLTRNFKMAFFVFILQPILGNNSYQNKYPFYLPCSYVCFRMLFCHSFIDFPLEKVNFPGTFDVIIQRWSRCYKFIKNDPQQWFRSQGTLIFFASVILLVCLHAWIWMLV